MGALYLSEDDVAWLLDMELSISSVEAAFVAWADGAAANQPRRRVTAGGCLLHSLSGAVALPSAEQLLAAGSTAEGMVGGYVGAKYYTTTRAGARFLVLLSDGQSGELLAVISADLLGQMRTGATTGVATKLMARHDASIVGCFGTGLQARTQLKAICAVRQIERIEVYSRSAERRATFAAEMSEYCNTKVVPVHSPEAAAAEKDIVVTATTSKVPVFDGQALDEGVFIAAVGSNFLTKAEVDVSTIRQADHIVCDSVEACQLEAGDFRPAIEAGSFEWSRAKELRDVLSGRETGRATDTDITLFKSVGLGLEDVAVASALYRKARAEGTGVLLPF